MKSLLIMIFSINLMACGTAEQSASHDVITAETAEAVPDFTRWSRIEGASDSCTSAEFGMNFFCQTEFMAGEKNCGLATFKFITVKNGYMYVQTKEGILIRQGEFHQINFTESPVVYNIDDSSSEKYYSVYYCKGQEG